MANQVLQTATATEPQILTDKNRLTIALAGNPNAGKTTLFNALTGMRQKVYIVSTRLRLTSRSPATF
jgi:GTPase Era involved in 16S rRNA processing